MSISTAVEARPLGEVAPVAARHRWILWFPVVAAVAVTHLLYPDGLFGQANYMVMTVGAATAAMVGTTRQPAAWRTAWGCVALAVALSAVGDITYSLIGLNNAVTYVGPADAFWLTSYVALAIGVSSLIVGGHGVRRVDLDGLIDMGSFAVLAVIVVTEFTVVRDVMTNQSYPISTRTVWTAYPVFEGGLARRDHPSDDQSPVAWP